MDLYNHVIFAAIACAAIFACTISYKNGRILIAALFAIDLFVYLFVQFDLFRIVIALLALISLCHELVTKKNEKLTRKIKLLSGFIFTGVGIFIALAGLPYFFLAGLVILLVAFKGSYWAWVGASYIAAFVLAITAFMSPVPMIGLFIIPIPTLLTITGIILYFKNSARSNK